MAVDLIFSQPPITGQPVELVFGQTDEPVAVDATVSCAITLPGLTGSVGVLLGVPVACTLTLPELSGSIGILYNSDTSRPAVGQVQSTSQEATAIESGLTQPQQHALTINTGVTARSQEAVYAHAGITPTFANALRTDAASTSSFRIGHRAPSPQLSGRFQDGQRDTTPRIQGRFQDGAPVPARLWGRFQDCLNDRRPSINSRWQDASPLHKGHTDKAGYAAPLHVYRAGRFQDAYRPPAGIHNLPVTPPVVPPYWGTELVFSCPPITGQPVDLVFGFVCIPQPAALLKILPARYYMVTHDVFAKRLPDMVDVPIFDVSVAADWGSYCWTMQASAPGSVFDQLFPLDGPPAQLMLTMDGIEWVFAIDPPDGDWEFAKTRTTIHGRSVTTFAGGVNPSTRSNAIDMTAQQIALDALTSTGIDLDWGIGAGALANGGMIDWLIPAGAWSHRGTPLEAVQTIVQAAGGHLQSHRTAATLLARHPYGQRVGDVSGAPWAWATGAADVELAQDAVLNQGLHYSKRAGINAAYVSGTTFGLLALVKRAGTAGDKIGDMVADPLITHADAARQKGLSIIGPSSGMFYDPVLELPVLTGPGQPGVLDVGQVVQVNANVPWRGRVRSVRVGYNRPKLRQSVVLERYLDNASGITTMHGYGMSSTNIFRALRDLIPEAPRQVATVSAVHTVTGDSTVTWPEGSQQRMLGTSVPIGCKAFVRGGVIECSAPDLPLVTIEI
ncbi:MAG: hypothetical protein FD135_2627 [Comamonadaceae bacterium]|nr:MAG: hypothetical protein FD135_2627 [Comamonadaceae bacterium]